MKSSGLSKFVDGKTLKIKLMKLTNGKREDVATFQDQIEYTSDLVTKMLGQLEPPKDRPIVVDDSAELQKLQRVIEHCLEKIAELEKERALLQNDVEMLKN